MSSVEEMNCCGLRELHHIGQDWGPKQTILTFCEDRFNDDEGITRPFVIFTDVASRSAGKRLHKFILENRLGEVTKSKTRVNGNTDHKIIMWTWSVNHTALKKWWEDNI